VKDGSIDFLEALLDSGGDYFSFLPIEIVYLIFCYLDPFIDLPVASVVCKVWYVLLPSPPPPTPHHTTPHNTTQHYSL